MLVTAGRQIGQRSRPHGSARRLEHEDAAARSRTHAVVLRQLVAETGGHLFRKYQRPGIGQRIAQDDLAPQPVRRAATVAPIATRVVALDSATRLLTAAAAVPTGPADRPTELRGSSQVWIS